MNLWLWVLLSALTAYLIKAAGFSVPASWLERPAVPTIAGALTVGLLASLTAANAVADGQRISLDSRLIGLLAAGLALKLKAPFLAVVVVGAAATALGRLAGLP